MAGPPPRKSPPPRPTAADVTESRLTTPVDRVPPIPPEDFLSTGCTLLNLAVSGHPDRGIPKGTYLYAVGASGSMKTWLAFMLFAEASQNRHFDGYRLVHDNAENGALMDVNKYFGPGVEPRLEPPKLAKDGTPVYSETAQEFYYHLESNVRKGPCIYVLDSMDALRDDTDEKKFEAELKRYETGKGEVPGSMGMAKAKTNSANINRVAQTLRTNGSILVVVSQTRDKVGGMYPGQKTRGGGHALKFYAHVELWSSLKQNLTNSYHGKEREIGVEIQFDVQKNRVSGWHGKLPLVHFLTQYGLDDVGSSVEFLIDEKHWKKPPKTEPGKRRGISDDNDDEEKKTKVIAAPEFKFEGKPEALIQLIQKNEDERELQLIVAKVWRDILANSMPVRKPRYGAV